MPDWAEHFDTFSLGHALTVALFLLFWHGLCAIGLRLRAAGAEAGYARGLALLTLLAWLLANGVQLLPGRFDAASNLPLHVCDLGGLLVPIALATRARIASAALYYWGFAFCLQAIATPELVVGPAHLDFWTFWVPHANIIGAAMYVLVVQRFRPGWRDCRDAYALALLYLAVMLPFDLLTGYNYGYLGPGLPEAPSLMDFLGPWPWRLLSIAAAAAAAFALLQLPWQTSTREPPR